MRRPGILVAAGLVVAALAVAYWLLTGYEPLREGANARGSLRYVEGAPAHYALELVNGGRLPVRITGVNLASAGTPLLVREEVRRGLDTDGSRRATQPFAPFTLWPGDAAPVTVYGHFDNCEAYEHGTSTRREVQLVRFRVLGVVAADQEVEFERPIVIAAPPDEDCPGR